MKPDIDPRGSRQTTQLILLNLCAIALAVLMLRHDALEREDELWVERQRRRELERKLKEREQQLDGALETIHRQAEPETEDGDDKPA